MIGYAFEIKKQRNFLTQIFIQKQQIPWLKVKDSDYFTENF